MDQDLLRTVTTPTTDNTPDRGQYVLWGIRCMFVLIWAGMIPYIIWFYELETAAATIISLVIAMFGSLVITVDVLFRRKKIAVITAVIFGMMLGLVASWLIVISLVPFIEFVLPQIVPARVDPKAVSGITRIIITSIVTYLSVSFVLQTKDEFRFIIPYFEFSRELRGTRPLLLDTSVLIDGRIADLAEIPLFDNPLIVPAFVLNELQMVADSSDKLKRKRGRQGLDILNRLRSNTLIDLRTDETELPAFQKTRQADQRLLLLAQHMNGKVVTNDFNLNKLARAQGIAVLNLNDVANALKPVVLPGENIDVKLIKEGDQPGQGVGYMDNGTMVVVENGKRYLGQDVKLEVTSVLQTSAGLMIFGRVIG